MKKPTFFVNLVDASDMTCSAMRVTRNDLISLMDTEGAFRVIVVIGGKAIKDYKRIAYAKKFASQATAGEFTIIRR